MKNHIYILLILLFFSCRENPPQPIVTPKSCPLPIQFTDPNAMPIGMHYASKMSPDGTKLFYSVGGAGANILDLKSLNISQFDIRPLLPKNTKLGSVIPVIEWCPYDNTKFVVLVRFGVDTVGDGKKFPGGEHLILCSIDGSYYKEITPKIFGPLGSQIPITLNAWLAISSDGDDWFLIGYRLDEHGKKYYGYFNPLTQELQEQEYKGLTSHTFDLKYNYYANFDSLHKLRYYINDIEMIFKDTETADMSYASFSPDGKYFAIAAYVNDKNKALDSTSRLAEVWIIDVEGFMKNPVQPVPVKIINIREKLCMFSYGLHPVFTSNNTLAVSMFKNGDTFSYLYEIDLEGNLIRQLTSVP